MEVNIKHTDQFDFGAYILNKEAEEYSAFQQTGCVFFTQENNNSLKAEILKLIDECKEVLKIYASQR